METIDLVLSTLLMVGLSWWLYTDIKGDKGWRNSDLLCRLFLIGGILDAVVRLIK